MPTVGQKHALLMLALLPGALAASGQQPVPYVTIEGGEYRSVIKVDSGQSGESDAPVPVAGFSMMTQPVTNADFLAFVQANPQWQRGSAPSVFVDGEYLSHWIGPTQLAEGQAQQPVTRISWFAANAYCAAQDARLPSWSEWEYAAAADETRRDARDDPAWRERILAWYSRPSNQPLPVVANGEPNAWGVRDLHGLVWEWVDDYNALFIAEDSRKQGDPELLKFCGAGAISMNDRENYAVLMRIAMLSSMNAAGTTRNLGFRCARDGAGDDGSKETTK